MLKEIFLILSIFAAVALGADKCFECNGHPDVPHYARNPRGCAWFFTCNPRQPAIPGRCPDPYVFNHDKQICDYADAVECTDAVPVTECPAKGFALIPHPDACSKFVVCFDGAQQDRDCEPGLHFSPADGKCVTPALAQCTIDEAFCSLHEHLDYFPKVFSTRNCNSFYVCSEGNVVPQRCAPDQHFNPISGFCEDEVNAGCDSSSVLPDLDWLPESIDFDCSSEIDGSAHPITDSCDFWYLCAGGDAFIQRCGTDAIFDVNEKRCVARAVDGSLCAPEEPPRRIAGRPLREMLESRFLSQA